eukprot:TRINITY_DN10389_c0_g1_i1.p1 TRINITY_DN10389_c0_g1~~TRINITY_DN10389_c0_g1_i1.p1  ORF type:complete len:427 (-),score=95.82 TRINITY_DN10389_c0_g1_i1:476-1756(-)
MLAAKVLDGGSASLVDRGYRVMVLDDCWMAYSRDKHGQMQPDPEKFPSGMKSLSSYLNARGIQLGLYTTPGNYTCEKRAASGGHEVEDAEQFIVNWGARYVKYCVCNTTHEWRMRAYNIFSDAVNATGIPTLLECDPFMEDPWTWMGPICNLWAAHNDIDDTFEAWLGALIELEERGVAKFAGPGQWNLPDMLSLGMKRDRSVRRGPSGRVVSPRRVESQSSVEYRSQMIMYAVVASPLVIGTDLRSASSETIDLYGSKEILDISQDSLGVQGRLLNSSTSLAQVWAKPLAKAGTYAVALINGDAAAEARISFTYNGVCAFGYNNVSVACVPSNGTERVVSVRQLVAATSGEAAMVAAGEEVSFVVKPHDTVLLLLENPLFEAESDEGGESGGLLASPWVWVVGGGAVVLVVAAAAAVYAFFIRKR